MVRLKAKSASLALALIAVAVPVITGLSGCASSASGPTLPTRAAPAQYRSVYQWQRFTLVSRSQLDASTSASIVETAFPPPSVILLVPFAHNQLFIGFTVARFPCVGDYYLSRLTYGPGALVTIRLALRRVDLPNASCIAGVTPPVYQVVELPLSQFPAHLRLEIRVVHANVPIYPPPQAVVATDRTYVRLARS
jgi:hypothetical protein